MKHIIWYEVYQAEPDLFDGDMKISRFETTSDLNEAMKLYQDGRNTIKRYTQIGHKFKIEYWDPETKTFK